jgi:hypothetical protein
VLVAEAIDRAGFELVLGPQLKIIDPELAGVTVLWLGVSVVQFAVNVVGGIAGKV